MSKSKHYNETEKVENTKFPNENVGQENDDTPTLSRTVLEFLERNPKRTFLGMVSILCLSIIGTVLYSVFSDPPKRPDINVSTASFTLDPISQGFGGLVKAGSSMTEVMQIKDEINELLSKETLTKQDSVKLLVAFERLEKINRNMLPNNKTDR